MVGWWKQQCRRKRCSSQSNRFEHDRKRRLEARVNYKSTLFAGPSCAFQQERESHATAHAEACEAESSFSFVQLVNERRRNAHTRAANRVGHRDFAAVNVQLISVEVKLAIAGDDLCGESFVQFDEIDVGEM